MMVRLFMLAILSLLVNRCFAVEETRADSKETRYTAESEMKVPFVSMEASRTGGRLLAGEVMGVSYSGFREGQHPDRGFGAANPSAAELSEDLDILLAHDFRLLRLYDSGENSRAILQLIRERGLPMNVMLGIWLDSELSNHEGCPWLSEPITPEKLAANRLQNLAEVERGIKLANEFPDTVIAVNVGNEALVDWSDHLVSLDSIIGYVRQVKAAIIQPVTVAENYAWWIGNGEQLASEIDFIGVHSYPAWESKTIDQGLAYTVENVEAVRTALPDRPIAILEAGWATTAAEFPEQANEANQRRYYQELKEWAGSTNTTVFFFEAFDEPWKGNPGEPLGAEKHWGLFTVDRKPKEVMQHSAPVLYDKNAVAWAVNVGGGTHIGIDGVLYSADEGIAEGEKGYIEEVAGTQDGVVYQSYRSGELNITRSIANGSYDITFQFAVPEDVAVGERVFDVTAQGTRVIEALDIRLARGGNKSSALSHTVTGVAVQNGQLDIRLRARAGAPLLSGIVVRARGRDLRRWELQWADEFDYEGAPDPEKWTIDVWPAGKVNNEDQAYTSRVKNVRVRGGTLLLEAHREEYGGAQYTSGRIHAKSKGDLLYGRVDIRAKLAVGQGTWSALWMLPSDTHRYSSDCSPHDDGHGDEACNAWPNSGEIDIMEYVGYDETRVHGTVHNHNYYGGGADQRSGSVEVTDPGKAFHIYTLEWTPERIDLFVDGSVYFSYFKGNSDWRDWPYNHPFHLILNLAIGGWWGRAGGPIDNSIFPASLAVDFVRVYKASELNDFSQVAKSRPDAG